MPPRDPSNPIAIMNALLSFARCVGVREDHEVYLSTPITTGYAFVDWRHSDGSQIEQGNPSYDSLHYEHVISPNISRVAPLVANLRKRYPDRLVIDPTSLEDVAGWVQEDYHNFWRTLIERYIAIVVFADGWQFSTGCVYEFSTALHQAKRIYDESFASLRREQGLRMIADAVAELKRLDVDSTQLRLALQEAEGAGSA